MNAKFKPLGLAAAVAAASAGMAGAAHATVANNALGDLAIVPYYTVQNDWVTGLHVTNTSNQVQIVKVRLRRGSDSADAMDINVIMSPEDVWTASISDESGTIRMSSDDSTCTAPMPVNGGWNMPPINAEGAEEGYIEVIGMGSVVATATGTAEALFVGSATHDAGTPPGCTPIVESAFFQNNKGETPANPAAKGVVARDTAHIVNPLNGVSGSSFAALPAIAPMTVGETGNVLKVSYFIRDAGTGIEFGNNAVHIADFGASPAMSNQQQGLANGDTTGFDYPDLNGTSYSVANAADRTLYADVIRADLGVSAVLNDWSYATERGVSTDWVITIPGQYTMVNWTELALSISDPDGDHEWDFRDLPVRASFSVWDREEGTVTPEEGGLVISPSRDPAPGVTLLENEVNVIEWGPESVAPVLDSELTTRVDTSAQAQPFGWASLAVVSGNSNDAAVCEPTDAGNPAANPTIADLAWSCTSLASDSRVPMAGFVAWQRTFSDAAKNYGRIVEHSFQS